MRRERTKHHHLSAGSKRTRYVGAELTGDTIDCLRHPCRTDNLRYTLAYFLVLGTDHFVASERPDFLNRGPATHDIDRLETQMNTKLQD
jgi:hypothetical protein